MTALDFRISGRNALLAGVACACLTTGAVAKDKPATPAGAKTISDFFATYAGKAAAAPPALVVTPEGSDYAVAIDIGALTTPMSGAGVGYQPAVLKYKVFEQDDGAWRVEQGELPAIVTRSRQGDTTIETSVTTSGAHSVTIIDPAISWIRSTRGGADKATLHQTGPGLENTIDFGPLSVDGVGKATADGVVSMDARETFGATAMKMSIDPKAANPRAPANAAPVNIAMQSDKAEIGVKLDGVKVRPALDLWAFLVAHPTREALAADEAAFKALATAALASQLSLSEEAASPKVTIQAQPGAFALEGVKGAVAFAVAGPGSRFEERIAIAKLTWPDGLVPPMYRDLAPTTFDFGVKVSGFDLNAAGTEAIADMHLAGEDPPISKADNEKVMAKLIGAGPVVIEIPPSHVVAPQLDLAIEGKITYFRGKPTGTLTLHMRNFDKTVTAMKSLGPDAEKQMLPALTMAKGLAKSEADGQLTWVGEVGADGIMKVNGLPLGKAPF
jgi:hypothetical protein